MFRLLFAGSMVAATRSGPLAGQQIDLMSARPCVRLLNATGTIGCATRSSGTIARVLRVACDAELTALLAEPPQVDVAVAVSAAFFSSATLHALADALGANLAGLLVLHASEPPPGGASPAPAVPLGASTVHAWNAAGDGFSQERWPFGIVLLEEADSASIERAIDQAVGERTPPLVEIRYPMSARADAPRCLAAGQCYPVGGQSVWGSLRPATVASALAPPDRPLVILTAPLDATGFFHDASPGADAAVSATAAVLGAVGAISSTPALASQLLLLPSTPLIFLFTGEAWGGLGSRRFLTDLRSFECTAPAPPPTRPAPSTSLPVRPACATPYKPDLRFLELRDAPLSAVLGVGAVGAAEAHSSLYVHTPMGEPAANTVSMALHAAQASLSLDVSLADANSGLGLPPGPAASFLDPKLARPAAVSHMNVAMLTDFDSAYTDGSRYGSRFDSLQALNASLVCAAAQLSAQSFWALAGGTGTPEVNCSFVREVIGCLLLDPSIARPADGSPPPPCALAGELGVEGDLTSHYTGVFLSSPGQTIISPTSKFVQLLLDQLLRRACETVAPSAACAPAVMLHDSYSAGIELRADGVTWEVVDAAEVGGVASNADVQHPLTATPLPTPHTRLSHCLQPLWAESNWPAQMFTRLYPYGAPNNVESFALLGVGAFSAALTYAIVRLSRHRYKTMSYKRL
jgi:nicastrin